MCILFVYTLLKLVSHYDLSVLSMSVMGKLRTKVWIGGGWFGLALSSFFGICLTMQSPLSDSLCSFRGENILLFLVSLIGRFVLEGRTFSCSLSRPSGDSWWNKDSTDRLGCAVIARLRPPTLVGVNTNCVGQIERCSRINLIYSSSP